MSRTTQILRIGRSAGIKSSVDRVINIASGSLQMCAPQMIFRTLPVVVLCRHGVGTSVARGGAGSRVGGAVAGGRVGGVVAGATTVMRHRSLRKTCEPSTRV